MAARFEPNSLMEAAETQIMQLEYARSMREPPWDGYCGLVQTSEEECLSTAGFRWSSGSGNAIYGSSPKYNPFGTPGSAAGNSTRSSISEPRQASSEFSAAGSSSLHPRALSSSKPPPPSQQPASTGTSPAQSRRPPRSVRPPTPPSQDATIILRRLSERLTAIRTDGEQQGAARGSQTAQLSAVTEESYKAGLACLESHDLKLAYRLLSLALNACPADRVRAQEKIKALLEKCRQPASG